MNDASDPAVSSSRYGLLASAIAGRRVAMQAGPGSLSSCDGQTIFLSVIESGGERMTLASVVAQAALIGAGSLNFEHIRRLVGRREAAQRYAYLEVLRAAKLLAGRLPNVFLELPEISGMHATTCSPAESLDWALSARSLPLAPSYFGCVRPLAVLRKAVSDEGLGALTSKQAAGKLAQQRIEAFDDDEDTEESKILKLLQNPLMGSNAISDVLNKILGVGASRGHAKKIPRAMAALKLRLDGSNAQSVAACMRCFRNYRSIHPTSKRRLNRPISSIPSGTCTRINTNRDGWLWKKSRPGGPTGRAISMQCSSRLRSSCGVSSAVLGWISARSVSKHSRPFRNAS